MHISYTPIAMGGPEPELYRIELRSGKLYLGPAPRL